MTTDLDFLPLTERLRDPSFDVRSAAFRTVTSLLRIYSSESLFNLVRNAVWESGELGRVSREALANLRPIADIQIQEPSKSEMPEAPLDEPEGTSEQWRKEVYERRSGIYVRLDYALRLAAVGDTQYVEELFEEIEQGPPLEPINTTYRFSQNVIERFKQIANDESRRRDIRQLAILFGRDELAEYATVFVTLLFNGCVRDDTAQYFKTYPLASDPEVHRYQEGNAIARFIGKLSVFTPDVRSLFEVYLKMHPIASPQRAEWYKTNNDDSILRESSDLAISFQIAWTASLSNLVQIVADLEPVLSGTLAIERLAAVEFIGDAIRWASADPPEFEGLGSSGELEAEVPSPAVSNRKQELIAEKGYKLVQVFYGTDRKVNEETAAHRLAADRDHERPKGSGLIRRVNYYGSAPGELQLGICDVSIPNDHVVGELESPSWKHLEFRLDPTKHVMLLQTSPLPDEEFWNTLRARVADEKNRQALVFVHGFNVTFEDGVRRTAQLANDLDIDVPILYSWPSRGTLFGYGADIEAAGRWTGRHLAAFLKLIAAESGAKTVHLIAHSMGTVPLTDAVQGFLDAQALTASPVFREVVLAAPDIDAQVFKHVIAPKIKGKGARITLYASSKDYALCCAKVMLRSGKPRAGDSVAESGVVVAGVDTIDTSAVNTNLLFGLLRGHSYVADRPAILNDLSQLLLNGHGPDERFGMERRILADLPYWVFKGQKK